MTGHSSSEVITSKQQILIKAQHAAEMCLLESDFSIVRAHPYTRRGISARQAIAQGCKIFRSSMSECDWVGTDIYWFA